MFLEKLEKHFYAFKNKNNTLLDFYIIPDINENSNDELRAKARRLLTYWTDFFEKTRIDEFGNQYEKGILKIEFLMENLNRNFDQVLNVKIKDILDLIENINEQIANLESEKSDLNVFLITQFNYQKIDFLKELCLLLISSNVATSKQIDSILDTINHLKAYEFTSIKKGKSLENQLFRLENILEEEQLQYRKVI